MLSMWVLRPPPAGSKAAFRGLPPVGASVKKTPKNIQVEGFDGFRLRKPFPWDLFFLPR